MSVFPNPDGRPVILDDPKKREQLLAGIAAGLSNKDACLFACVKWDTFRNRKRRDPQLAEDVRRARVQGKAANIKIIRDAARGGDWKAAAWLLSKQYPEEYAERHKHEVTGKGGGAIQVSSADVTKLNDEELRQLRQLRLKMDRLSRDDPAEPKND